MVKKFGVWTLVAGLLLFSLYRGLPLYSIAEASGTTYYIDATNGSDSNTGTDPATPWQTIEKVNTSTFQPGDSILFKRGEIWRETLNVVSGSAGSPITYGSYGSGDQPEINGADAISGWVSDPGTSNPSLVKHVGEATTTTGFTTTQTITIPASGVAIGNQLMVSFIYNTASGSYSVADSRGNTYTQHAFVQANSSSFGVFTSRITTALQPGDTITVTGTVGCSRRSMSAEEFTGLDTSPVDQVKSSSGSGTAISSGSTSVTTQANELVVGFAGWETGAGTETVTPGSGYTEITHFSNGSAGLFRSQQIQYKTVSSTSTQASDLTISISHNWFAAAVTFKAAAAESLPGRYKKTGLGFTPNYLWSESADGTTVLNKVASASLVSSPGDWYYDSGTDSLYYFPPDGTTPDDSGTIIEAAHRNRDIYGGLGKSYVTLQDLHLKFTNGTTVDGAIYASNNSFAATGWILKNLLVEWSGSSGILLNGVDFSSPKSLTISNVETRYNREHGLSATFYENVSIDALNTHSNGRQGAGLILRSSTINNSTFAYNSNKLDLWGLQSATVQGYDAGLYMPGSPTTLVWAGNNFIESNIAHHNAKAGMATDALSDNNTFLRNQIYQNDIYGLFFEGGTENGSYGNKAYNNTIWGNQKSGLQINNGHGAFDARNNLFYSNGRDGSQDVFIQFQIAGTWSVYSGAIYKRTNVRWAPSVLASPSGIELTQVSGIPTEAGQWYYDSANQNLYVWRADSAAVTEAYAIPQDPWTLDYNDYTPMEDLASGEKNIRYTLPSGAVSYTSISTFALEQNQETHGLQVDPLYTNSANADFTLQPTSPAIDAGADLGADYALALAPDSEWPDSVKTLDQATNGSGWEIGAYAYPDDTTPAFSGDDSSNGSSNGSSSHSSSHGREKESTPLPLITPSYAPTPSSYTSIIRSLYRGYSGSDVESLQRYLIDQGLLAVGNATGYFGPLTQQGVESFQKREGIVSSGSVDTTGWGAFGPITRSRYNELISNQGSTTLVSTSPLTNSEREAILTQIRDLQLLVVKLLAKLAGMLGK
jgi:hypothetical protein